MRRISFALFSLFLLAACEKNTVDLGGSDKAPEIIFQSMTPLEVHSGRDSVFLSFSFFDGDGDLGANTNSPSVFLVDSRDSTTYQYFLPAVNEFIRKQPKGYEGVIRVNILAAALVLDSLLPDNLHYEVHVVDAAGNASNSFTTPTIKILP